MNTLNDTTLRDDFGGTADSKIAVPLTAYTTKPLKNLLVLSDNRYLLSGPYVRPDDRLEFLKYFSIETGISSEGTLASTKLDFFFDRESAQFEAVKVYQVIDTNQRYIQSLGFNTATNNSINKRPIKVDPHGHTNSITYIQEDISSYEVTPTGNYITFGEGGVDDAEDADIILHEYGHAIQDYQAPDVYQTGCGTEAGAMSEGFGDYWQASNTRNISKVHGFDPACFAEWDWTADAKNTQGTMCRRRVDSTKRYADKKGDCHDDGEIWSSALWEILTKFGATEAARKKADRLILQSHFEMRDMGTTNPTFIDGGIALLKADKTLIASGVFLGGHKNIICKALKTNRDIPVPCCL
ncbi:MAG: M36 family metallopeptidase [Methylococcaceae bacterium]